MAWQAVLLVWLYYSAMVLFLGVQFTHVYAARDRADEPATRRGAHPERVGHAHTQPGSITEKLGAPRGGVERGP